MEVVRRGLASVTAPLGSGMDYGKLKAKLLENAQAIAEMGKQGDPVLALGWLSALREVVMCEWEEEHGPVGVQEYLKAPEPEPVPQTAEPTVVT